MLLSGQAMEQVKLTQMIKIYRSIFRWSYNCLCFFNKCINQAMPATGLGPSSMGHPGLTGSQGPAGLPGGPPGPGGGGGGGPLPISIPPQYSQSSYHPSYMQQVRFVSLDDSSNTIGACYTSAALEHCNALQHWLERYRSTLLWHLKIWKIACYASVKCSCRRFIVV